MDKASASAAGDSRFKSCQLTVCAPLTRAGCSSGNSGSLWLKILQVCCREARGLVLRLQLWWLWYMVGDSGHRGVSGNEGFCGGSCSGNEWLTAR